MAEEFDSTQKPKVTLIKHPKKAETPEAAPAAPQAPEADHVERRKVVVVKKKPTPAPVPQEAAPA